MYIGTLQLVIFYIKQLAWPTCFFLQVDDGRSGMEFLAFMARSKNQISNLFYLYYNIYNKQGAILLFLCIQRVTYFVLEIRFFCTRDKNASCMGKAESETKKSVLKYQFFCRRCSRKAPTQSAKDSKNVLFPIKTPSKENDACGW